VSAEPIWRPLKINAMVVGSKEVGRLIYLFEISVLPSTFHSTCLSVQQFEMPILSFIAFSVSWIRIYYCRGVFWNRTGFLFHWWR